MSLWSRIKGWFGGGKAASAPPPGRWIEGAKWSWRGWIALAPLRLPRRRYRLYLPAGWSKAKRAPLIVLCHGCQQTPETFARGTRIEALADREGALVLMPDQSDGANPFRCWNWFDGRTIRGKGEAAIVASMIARTIRRCRADRGRVVAAGMSAGGGLAAVLGVRHPGLVRGVVVHSGIACGAASSVLSAMTVMARGPDNDVGEIGREARAEAGSRSRVPLLAIHGKLDTIVAPRNAAALAREYLALNGIAVPPGSESTLPDADRDARETPDGERAYRVREWSIDGRPIVRLVEIDGLGHAWSGGDASLPFNDARGPDSTAMLGDWLSTVGGG